MTKDKGQQYSIMILGDGAVGKTSIIKRFTDDEFDEDHLTTLGLDFKTVDYSTKVDSKAVKMKIWDTAGQERFKTLTYSFYRKADGVIISFDVTDQKSFDNVKNWVESINQHADQSAARVLVGNKIDLDDDRCVTKLQAE